MENFTQAVQTFIVDHAHLAHWYVFVAILLAGMHVPISIDVVVILGAVLAATVVPEKTVHLYLGILLGCMFAAWISYWIGRLIGPKLLRFRFFQRLVPPKRLERLHYFYKRYGLFTLIIGRFIPFGVRNCIFFTTGMSKISFPQFIYRDAIACLIWCSSSFYIFYILGKNFDTLYDKVKTFNIAIFVAFAMAVIGVIWYKKKKRKKVPNPLENGIEQPPKE